MAVGAVASCPQAAAVARLSQRRDYGVALVIVALVPSSRSAHGGVALGRRGSAAAALALTLRGVEAARHVLLLRRLRFTFCDVRGGPAGRRAGAAVHSSEASAALAAASGGGSSAGDGLQP